MKAKIFNKDSIKNISPKNVIKKAGVLITAGSLVLALSACDGKTISFTKKPQENRQEANYNQDINIEDTKPQECAIDPAEDYSMLYTGDSETVKIGDGNFIEYKANDNAFTRDASNIEDTQVTISLEKELELKDELSKYDVEIPYSGLFNLEHLMGRQDRESISGFHSYSINLVDGKISADELYKTVKSNNANYPINDPGYYELSDDEIKQICDIFTDSINHELETNGYIDIEATLCNLGSLKIVGEESVTNARVTYDNVLAISKDMIQSLQISIQNGDIDAYENTIIHEGEHIPQINCFDEIDKSTGNRIGFNRKWEGEPINSLFWNWYYEASAETLMVNKTDTDNIVYENQTNYLKYFKVACLPDPNFDITSLEKVSVSRDADDFYSILKAHTKEEKQRVASMMYAVEIIQNQNMDFERIYANYIGKDSSALENEEWGKLKRELKAGLGLNMSRMFYTNLIEYVKTGNATLSDIYRLITLFEAETEQHLLYDSTTRFQENEPFMEGYREMQVAFFRSISTSMGYSYEEIVEGFNNYSMKDVTYLYGLPSTTVEFIELRENELIKHMTTGITKSYQSLVKEYGHTKTLKQ